MIEPDTVLQGIVVAYEGIAIDEEAIDNGLYSRLIGATVGSMLISNPLEARTSCSTLIPGW